MDEIKEESKANPKKAVKEKRKADIYTALNKFQALVQPVVMNKRAIVKYEKNGQWQDKSYSYADLSAIWQGIRKPLCDSGLAITHGIKVVPVNNYYEVNVSTKLVHTLSGQSLDVDLLWNVSDNKIHTLGSMVTYLKRYGISAILGIVTEEDDDGGRANNDDKPRKEPVKAPEKPVTPKPVSAPPTFPTDEQQAQNGLISSAQVKELQEARNQFNVPDTKWKLYLQAAYNINTAWKIKVEWFEAIHSTLVLNTNVIKDFSI